MDGEKTTEDLVNESGEGEFLPADEPEDIEPYVDATPVPDEGDE